MTATNHAVTGALVGIILKEPIVALPAALLSHFVIDALPHWDYKVPDHPRVRQAIIGLDVILSFCLLIIFALVTDKQGWLLFTSGALANLPDAMWLPYILYGQPAPMKRHTLLHRMRYFHFKIHGYESRIGLVTELVWFVIVLSILVKVAL